VNVKEPCIIFIDHPSSVSANQRVHALDKLKHLIKHLSFSEAFSVNAFLNGLKKALPKKNYTLYLYTIKSNKAHFFPSLYYDPAKCDFILMKIKGKPEKFLINGVASDYEVIKGTHFLKFDTNNFEPWENIVFTNHSIKNILIYPGFYVDTEREIELPIGQQNFKIRSIDGLYEQDILTKKLKRYDNSSWNYIFNARNTCIKSRFYNTFFSAYDLDNKTYRLNSWVWSSAIVVKALLEEYALTKKEEYLIIAKETGDALLGFQKQEGPEAGGIMVRWDVWQDSPTGIVPWLAPNDSAIIGSYAFLPLYQETKDTRYLEAAMKIGEWIIKNGMSEEGRLYAGYREDIGIWDKSWLYVDAGFAGTLFEGLYEITGEVKWKKTLKLFIDDFIKLFWCEDGYFYKNWTYPNQKDRNIYARGQAWALDGLISAYKVLKEEKYLEKILACADYLVEHQNENGSWNYLLNIKDSGECNKGTPIIAYHLFRLSNFTKKTEKYYNSARKAMEWCEANQYKGSDTNAVGGIHAYNTEGCIVGVRNTDTIFTYANAYYILARNLLRRTK